MQWYPLDVDILYSLNQHNRLSESDIVSFDPNTRVQVTTKKDDLLCSERFSRSVLYVLQHFYELTIEDVYPL